MLENVNIWSKSILLLFASGDKLDFICLHTRKKQMEPKPTMELNLGSMI
jgi:hypothetical protein